MDNAKILPEDPRLTAYALDEMTPAERAKFELILQHDSVAQKMVEEIRATGALLADALEHEPDLAGETLAPPTGARDKYAKVVRFPYWMVSSLAAACFTLVFIFWQRESVWPVQKDFLEVPVTAANATKVEAKAKGAGEKEADVAISFGVENAPPLAALRAPSPAAEGMAASPSVADAVKLDSFQVMESRAASFGAQAVGRGGEMHRAEQAQASMMAKKSHANQPASRAEQPNTEAYAFKPDNGFLASLQNPLSTFAVDVDTASYANVRRFLQQGQRPPVDAVRIEELVNYFPYSYAGPENSQAPFAAHLEVASAPWAPAHRLVRIGLKGREVSAAARPAANLVFLLDVSGSMNQPNKLPLVKQSLRLLVEKLRPDDRVAIAVYAGASGLALPSTSAAHKAEIMDAIDRLQAEGSTNGARGIQLAYDVAKANFVPGGVNRVILATDGDFNVGLTSEGGLVRLIEEKAQSGVFLTVLGFGMGNLKDSTLEQLADKGNGNYAYIDSLAEAKKTLVEQAGGTLMTIAKDVKIQVEFNPLEVSAYRLIGYENRLLAQEDFNNDQVDAGEIGAGHTVTALYEVVPAGVAQPEPGGVDALKYQGAQATGATATPPSKHRGEVTAAPELLTVKIRYKEPTGDVSSKLEFPLRDTNRGFADASQDFKFAAAVAAFGMVLRDSPEKGTSTLSAVETWGRDGIGSDAGGYRHEFIELVGRAQQLVE